MPIPKGGRVRFSKKLIYKNKKPYKQRFTFTKKGKVVETKLFKVCPRCGYTKIDKGGQKCPKCGYRY